jgi:hypothetical protein
VGKRWIPYSTFNKMVSRQLPNHPPPAGSLHASVTSHRLRVPSHRDTRGPPMTTASIPLLHGVSSYDNASVPLSSLSSRTTPTSSFSFSPLDCTHHTIIPRDDGCVRSEYIHSLCLSRTWSRVAAYCELTRPIQGQHSRTLVYTCGQRLRPVPNAQRANPRVD